MNCECSEVVNTLLSRTHAVCRCPLAYTQCARSLIDNLVTQLLRLICIRRARKGRGYRYYAVYPFSLSTVQSDIHKDGAHPPMLRLPFFTTNPRSSNHRPRSTLTRELPSAKAKQTLNSSAPKGCSCLFFSLIVHRPSTS